MNTTLKNNLWRFIPIFLLSVSFGSLGLTLPYIIDLKHHDPDFVFLASKDLFIYSVGILGMMFAEINNYAKRKASSDWGVVFGAALFGILLSAYYLTPNEFNIYAIIATILTLGFFAYLNINDPKYGDSVDENITQASGSQEASLANINDKNGVIHATIK